MVNFENIFVIISMFFCLLFVGFKRVKFIVRILFGLLVNKWFIGIDM